MERQKEEVEEEEEEEEDEAAPDKTWSIDRFFIHQSVNRKQLTRGLGGGGGGGGGGGKLTERKNAK